LGGGVFLLWERREMFLFWGGGKREKKKKELARSSLSVSLPLRRRGVLRGRIRGSGRGGGRGGKGRERRQCSYTDQCIIKFYLYLCPWWHRGKEGKREAGRGEEGKGEGGKERKEGRVRRKFVRADLDLPYYLRSLAERAATVDRTRESLEGKKKKKGGEKKREKEGLTSMSPFSCLPSAIVKRGVQGGREREGRVRMAVSPLTFSL